MTTSSPQFSRSHFGAPKRHHIDRRAYRIVAGDAGADDDLMSTRQVADWLGISTQWLEIGRCKNYGPRFTADSRWVITHFTRMFLSTSR
jgi:hypothetical protein